METTADSFSTETLLGSQLNLQTLLPVNFAPNRECTLNNYFNIFPNEPINEAPKLRYYGVGISGKYNVDDKILGSAYVPERTNMNLFQPIPIRCRLVDEDLTDAERAQYRLRQRKTLADGNDYYLYYLKVLEFQDGIRFKRTNPVTGVEESYELNTENLEPKPVKPNSTSTIISDTTGIVAYATSNIHITSDEVLEYIRVQYNGDTRYSLISEIGWYTGVDTVVNGYTGDNIPIQYTESIYTMLHTHQTNCGFPLMKAGQEINSAITIQSTGGVSLK